jgi:hypothetical protein
MKKKLNKYRKLKTNSEKNMDQKMNADHKNSANENATNLNVNELDDNNNYPSDIQGLFERLGII